MTPLDGFVYFENSRRLIKLGDFPSIKFGQDFEYMYLENKDGKIVITIENKEDVSNFIKNIMMLTIPAGES